MRRSSASSGARSNSGADERVGVADALHLLDDWLTTAHHLRREQIDRSAGVWRKRSDVAASVQRGTKSLVGGTRLGDGVVRRLGLRAIRTP